MFMSISRLRAVALALFVLLVLNGCGGEDTSNAQSDRASSDGTEQLFAVDGDFAGAHILVAYAGASRVDASVTRSKEEAQQKAADLIAQLKDDPSQFEELARTESDGPSGPSGGDLGTWQKGRMVPEFDTAIEGLEIGGITTDPVETAFGFHIIRRNDIPKVAHYIADAFIIGYTGLPQTPSTVTRDSAEAAALVEEIKGKINGANFDELSTEYNDYGEGATSTGLLREGNPAPLGLIELLKTMDFGEAGGPITLPVGFAFVRRVELVQRAGAHILFAYQGAMRADPELTRTKEEALTEAKRVLAMIQDDPSQFEAMAAEHTDDPTGKTTGGNLGTWFKGMMVPEFDNAIDELGVDEIAAEPVETDFGYHLIIRREVE